MIPNTLLTLWREANERYMRNPMKTQASAVTALSSTGEGSGAVATWE